MRSEPGTILAVLLACLLGFTTVAAMPADSLGPPADAVQLRSFDEAALDAYRADPAYDYERIAARPPTPWERFKEWLFRRIGDLLGSGVGRFVSRNIFYLIVAAGLLLAIWVLRKGGLQRVFGGDLPVRGRVSALEEDIRELDLEAQLREAEDSGDLRRAIRVHYLLVLRGLVDRGLLHWSPDHTDRDYLAQLKDPGLQERFARAARIFQWVWYGHAEVGPERYAALRRPFTDLHAG